MIFNKPSQDELCVHDFTTPILHQITIPIRQTANMTIMLMAVDVNTNTEMSRTL